MSGFSVQGVSFSYDDYKVFDDVSLDIPGGKVTAFLGANGSGKTTMQRLLLGLLRPSSGSILLDGRPLTEYGVRDLSRRIGWVPQVEEPNFPYTVREYLTLGRAPYLGFFDAPDHEDSEIVDQVLDRLGLYILAEREVTRMSGGEKRMILIARALVQEPSVMVLDEPTSHLDPANKTSILALLKRLGDTGNTVVFSTHDPNEAIRAADNVILFCEGDILACGETCDVLSEENLKRIYKADLRILHMDDRYFVDFEL
jgi:iron complex transport system ATP-binding protein